MIKLRVGIHGLGRIGRAVFRIQHDRRDFDIVLINEINPDIHNIAYLLNHDSLYGGLKPPIQVKQQQLCQGAQMIAVSHCPDITQAPWQAHGVDVIVDASGTDNAERLIHWHNFPGWTISTHACHRQQLHTIVFGVNEQTFQPALQRRLSSSICDTVALAPLVKLLEQHYGIAHGRLTTLHPCLSSQHLLDSAALAGSAHDDTLSHYTLGRSALNNLLPKTTSAVLAADAVLPGLSTRMQGFSYRVPTSSVSSAVLDVSLCHPATVDTVHQHLHTLAQQQRHAIIQLDTTPKVSQDYCGNAHSVCVDQRWTTIQAEQQLRLVYWYDNEWGYSARVVDLIGEIARHASASGQA